MIEVMEDVKQSMIDALKRSVTIPKVARDYKVSYYYVRLLAAKNNIPTFRGRPLGQVNVASSVKKAAIVDELSRTSNMAEVARAFGVSREYVRQIGEATGVRTTRTREVERSENVATIQPFIDLLKSSSCWQCGNEVSGVSRLHLCEVCTERRRQIGITLCRVKAFLLTGNLKALNQAAWTVREFGITAEDLKGYGHGQTT